MRSLSVRLSLAFLIVVLLAIAIMAILVNRATTSEFGNYLAHQQAMGQMMGRGAGGMMGPLDSAEQGFLNSVNGWLDISALVAGGLAVLLGIVLARQISAPLHRLASASRRIAGGDLDARVKVESKDEVGQLSSAFNDMATALARDHRLRRQMIADIAHELGTPISVIQGNLEAMLDGVRPLSPEQIVSLHDETLFLSRIVSDLRQLALAEAGQLKLNRESTDLAHLLQHAVEAMQPSAQDKKLSLTASLPQDLPFAAIDADRITQVVRNLLTNAVRYTAEGGSIVVKAEREENNWLRVSVSDTGAGIAPEDLPRIFDRFYRADRSRSKDTGGAGLGLAIAKELVAAHGGRIWVESQPGKGSIFYFTVPAATSP